MKRIRSWIVSSVLLAVAAFGPPSWAADPQPELPAPSPAEVQADAIWQQAGQLQQGDRLQQAADRYQAIMAQETHWKKRAKAALLAADCLDRLGKAGESIALLDTAISEADSVAARSNEEVDQSWTCPALFIKAGVCEKTGDRAGAIQAIDRLRAEFFKSDKARQALEIRARLERWSPQRLAQAMTQEQEAMQMAEQAAEASKQKRPKEAIESCDRIIKQYPDTAAVFPALRTKALALWQLHKYKDAKAVYRTILDRVGPIAPHSNLVHTAQYRIAWLDSGDMSKDFVARKRKDAPPRDEEWQQLRDRCQVVITLDPDPKERADAELMIIESYCWQQRPDESLRYAEEFLRQHDGDKKAARFGVQAASAHVFAAIAAERLGRYDEANRHLDRVFEATSRWTDYRQREHVLDTAYFWRWHILHQTGADDAQLRQLANQHIAEFPDSPNADFVRAYMLRQDRERFLQSLMPASQPKP
jgi:tetratricopeptide (TPR) repeat protein